MAGNIQVLLDDEAKKEKKSPRYTFADGYTCAKEIFIYSLCVYITQENVGPNSIYRVLFTWIKCEPDSFAQYFRVNWLLFIQKV